METENHFCISVGVLYKLGCVYIRAKIQSKIALFRFSFTLTVKRKKEGKEEERERETDHFTSTLRSESRKERERIDLCPGMADDDRRKEVSSYCRASLNSPLARNA